MNGIFSSHKILSSQLLFWHFKISFHSQLTFIISFQKIAVIIKITLGKLYHLPLATFRIFSLVLVWSNFILMCLNVTLFICFWIELHSCFFMSLWLSVLEIYLTVSYLFLPFSSLSPSGMSIKPYRCLFTISLLRSLLKHFFFINISQFVLTCMSLAVYLAAFIANIGLLILVK